MAVEIDPSLDYRHWRKDHVSVFPAIHSSFVNYSARPEVLAGLREAGFASFDAINYLSQGGLFRYDAALFSGGGAELDIQKSKAINPSIWNRRADTVLMSDSGGFQVATGVLAPKQYYELREKITAWQEAISDIAIAMDVPTGSVGNRKAICIDSFDEYLTLTKDNFDWQMRNRNPKTGEARAVFVGDKLRKELERYVTAMKVAGRTGEAPFLLTQKHTAFSPNTLCQLFTNLYAAAGIDGASSHSGRRWFITRLAHSGVSAKVIMTLAGHRHLSTVRRVMTDRGHELTSSKLTKMPLRSPATPVQRSRTLPQLPVQPPR